jgi:hypothetical protein
MCAFISFLERRGSAEGERLCKTNSSAALAEPFFAVNWQGVNGRLMEHQLLVGGTAKRPQK